MTRTVCWIARDGRLFMSEERCRAHEQGDRGFLLSRIQAYKTICLPSLHSRYLESKEMVRAELKEHGVYGRPEELAACLFRMNDAKERLMEGIAAHKNYRRRLMECREEKT